MAGDGVIILGGTSAVAERYARRQAARGARLLLVGRNAERLAVIATDLVERGAAVAETAVLDLAVPPPEGYEAAWSALVERLGGKVDVVLLAYGVLGDQKAAEADPAEAVRLLTTNMVGACAWMTAAAIAVERQGAGTLIAISSVAGDRGRQSNYVYGAAKGGLALFMEGLAHRFAGTAIRVLTVKPGFIDTPMTDGMAKGGPLWASPDKVAADIDRAAVKGRTILYTPWFWGPIMRVIRHLPRAIFHRLKI
ncbi:MAG: SDR family oxidoreductase [Negativicutes bacterium]|nr:SDR family oxidoreductase [Negativicutes bacterium]